MAYKTGDKFVIEIDSVMTNKKGNLYGIKGFKVLVFDDYGLEQLEKVPSKDEVPSKDDCLKVGDVVFNDSTGSYAIVTRADDDCLYLLFKDGSCGLHSQTGNHWKKAETAWNLDLRDLFSYIRIQGENNDRN